MSLFSYGKYNGSGATSSLSKNEPFGLADKKNQNTGNNSKINFLDFAPKRFGLKYDPPTIILEYLIPSSGKLYHHKMKIMTLTYDSNTQEIIDYLKKRHSQYFQNNKVSEDQISALIEKLKQKLGSNLNNNKTTKPFSGLSLPSYGANPSTSIAKPKDSLDSLFDVKNKKDDKNKLQPLSSIGSNLSKTTPNSTFGSYGSYGSYGTNSTKTNDTGNSLASKTSTNFWEKKPDSKDPKFGQPKALGSNDLWMSDHDEENTDEEINYNQVNLNKLAPEEVQKHKEKMSVMFNKNQKKPGDPDFVYDKQEEFNPHEDNEWDEDF